MNNNIAIKAEQITKIFGDFTAVDHISFEVSKGEILGNAETFERTRHHDCSRHTLYG